MNRAIVTMILFAAGCAGTGGLSGAELLSQAPVVTAAPGAEGSDGYSMMEEADARIALENARAAFLREDYEQVIELVKTTLEEGVPAEIGQELRMLRFEAKRRLLTREILSGRILPVKDVYTFGEDVEFELTLRNLSTNTVEVPETEPGSSRAVFVLEVSREDWDYLGNVRTEARPQLVVFSEDLDIGVGKSHATRHVIPTVSAEKRHRGFTLLKVSGSLRPAVIRSGEERYYTAVALQGALVRIVPPGYEPLAADPLGSIEKAFRLGAAEHLLIAAELAPPEQLRGLVEILIGLLDRPDNNMAETVMAVLRRKTGESFANRPQGWITWWKEEGVDVLD